MKRYKMSREIIMIFLWNIETSSNCFWNFFLLFFYYEIPIIIVYDCVTKNIYEKLHQTANHMCFLNKNGAQHVK